MKKIKSFTLAEVLITLVVIGIIAAITVPVIMANHKKTETASKLKKFYSTMSNAVKLSETENGIPSYEWGISCKDKEENHKDIEKYLLKYISYSKYEKIQSGDDIYNGVGDWVEGDPEFGYKYYLNDGSMFFTGDCSYIIYYDVNGDKGPNQSGRDIFNFYIISNDDGDYGIGIVNNIPHFNTKDWSPIPCEEGYERYFTRDYILSNSCNGQNSSTCSTLIEMDGWEIKDDYPFRL